MEGSWNDRRRGGGDFLFGGQDISVEDEGLEDGLADVVELFLEAVRCIARGASLSTSFIVVGDVGQQAAEAHGVLHLIGRPLPQEGDGGCG